MPVDRGLCDDLGQDNLNMETLNYVWKMLSYTTHTLTVVYSTWVELYWSFFDIFKSFLGRKIFEY